MPAPHAFYSKMLAERTASRNVFVLLYFILFIATSKQRVHGFHFIGYHHLSALSRLLWPYCRRVQSYTR